MSKTLVVAAAQLAPVFLDRDATTDKVCATIAEAGASGARLVVFPETLIPCYPYWNIVVDPFTNRPRRHRKLFEQAVELGSPTVAAIARASKQAKCVAVVGINERSGGTLYNSQLVIDADGEILGCRRKLVPTHHERMTWGNGDGSDMNVYDTSAGKVGALVCYEHANPLFRYAIQAQGEEIHAASWPGGAPWTYDIVDAAMRHYAFEGQCFVVSATGVVTAEFLQSLGGDAGEKIAIGGGHSAIVGPGGNYLAKAETDGETLLLAELNFEDIVDRKEIVDTSGHYARPDVVQLKLKKKRRRPLLIREP